MDSSTEADGDPGSSVLAGDDNHDGEETALLERRLHQEPCRAQSVDDSESNRLADRQHGKSKSMSSDSAAHVSRDSSKSDVEGPLMAVSSAATTPFAARRLRNFSSDLKLFDIPTTTHGSVDDVSTSTPTPTPAPKTAKTQNATTELSKKEIQLRKRRFRRSSQIQRRDSLDLLDAEVDFLPGVTPTEDHPLKNDWVIAPDSPFVTYWLSIIYMITVYDLIVIPFRISFGFLDNQIGFWFVFDLFTDVFLWADIYLNHHIGFFSKGRKILNLHSIGARYRGTWALPDLCASLPLDLIQIAYGRILPAIRVPRLLRGVHILALIDSIEKQPGVNIAFIRVVKLAMFTMFLNHYAACTWFALGRGLQAFGDWPVSAGIMSLPTISQYIRSLYWAMTNMTGRGVEYPPPTNDYVALFVVLYLIACVLFYIYVISTTLSLVETANSVEASFQTQVAYISAFLSDQGLPKHLQVALQEYFSYLWQMHRGHDAKAVMQLLPPSIALDVQTFLCKSIVVRCHMFQQIDPSALSAVISMLTPRVCAPGEFIIHYGLSHASMFFIQQGELEVLGVPPGKEDQADFVTLSFLVAGDAFGELQLLLDVPSSTSIRAVTFCQLFEFTHDNFRTLQEVYPNEADVLIRAARHLLSMRDEADALPSERNKATVHSARAGPDETAKATAGGDYDHNNNNVDSMLRDDVADLMEKGMTTAPRRGSDMTTSDPARSRRSSAGSISKESGRELVAPMYPAFLKRYWHYVVVVATIYNVAVVPVRIAFLDAATSPNAWPFLAVDVVVDLVFLVDIALRLRFPKEFPGSNDLGDDETESIREVIRSSYFQKQVVILIVASFPLDWMTVGVIVNGHALNVWLRALRFIRLAAVSTILFTNPMNRRSSTLLMFTRTVFHYVIVAHVLVMVNALVYGDDQGSGYLAYATVTVNALTGLGRSTRMPTTDVELIVAMATHLTGVAFLAVCIGSLASYITQRNALEGSFSRDMLATQQYLEFRNIPPGIRDRARTYFESMWSTMGGIMPSKALASLPSSLRTRITIELCRNVIKNMPIFQGVSERFIYDLVPRTEYEVYPAGEYIVRRGQMQNGKMYFVTRGILSIILDEAISTKPYKMIGTGSFFGECALLTESPIRRASVRTETLCHVLSISKQHLVKMFSMYPVFEERMRQFAQQRVKRLEKTQQNMEQILAQITDRIEHTKLVANRTYNFIMYESCFVGSELVDWIISKGYCDNREDAAAIGSALFEKGAIRQVDEVGARCPPGFHDGLFFYRLGSYVDRLASSDIEVEQVSVIEREDMALMNELVHNISVDRNFKIAQNLISARALIEALLPTENVGPEPSQVARAQARGEALAQRLLDCHLIQNTRRFEVFENNDTDEYRIRFFDSNDPKNVGPSAPSLLISGRAPAFSGHVVVRGRHTFLPCFIVLMSGAPSFLYVFQSKRADHPERIWQVVDKAFVASRIEETSTRQKLSCVHLRVVEAVDAVAGPPAVGIDKRAETMLVLCFERGALYETLVAVLKGQGYTQRIRALTATVWNAAS
ncbi:unnamed protein product (mitochondrion) [Plasmodiophora brassicae]|uniref:Cyclic nucleotide-binding domain-containing protein n=1 Tax=Plasmodiophora brassicae TaxID=37360 RepID=A0A3P3Y5P0_PLABS|nr:unnamed protein product [Plasmodiophora brassicae]